MYPIEIVAPMKEQLTNEGFTDASSVEAVESGIKQSGTTLWVINSVCGCSAGTARPGVLMSLNGEGKKPNHLQTSFAGYDMEAVQQIRQHMMPYPPSSPCIALFKDGALVHMIERHMIEGRSAEMIAANLTQAYQTHCN